MLNFLALSMGILKKVAETVKSSTKLSLNFAMNLKNQD